MKSIISLAAFMLIFFTYSANCQQQMENPGFEYWEEIGFGPDTLEPAEWNSLKTSDGGEFINNVIPVVWYRSTDAHSGMYSVKLVNTPIAGLVAPGTLTNGRVHATLPPSDAYVYTIDSLPEFSTSFNDKPDSLQLWAKFFPDSSDIAHVIVVLHTDTAKIADSLQTNWVAVANIDFTTETPGWTKFTAPFVYLSNDVPEYILFAVYAGDAADAVVGSTLYIDDISLIYNNTGIAVQEDKNVKIIVTGNKIRINLSDIKNIGKNVIKIYDISGKQVYKRDIGMTKNCKIDTGLRPGVYICNITNSSAGFTQKILIQ
jgi:hypothetical protein